MTIAAWSLPFLFQATMPIQETGHLAALASEDPSTREEAGKAVLALEDGPRIRILRRGLASEAEETARWCALHLPPSVLDLGEMARATALLLPELAKTETRLDFENLRTILSGEETAEVLRILGSHPRHPDSAHRLRRLHKNLQPSHLPLLCRLILSADPGLANAAFGDLFFRVLPYTVRNRDLIARTFLARRPKRELSTVENPYGLQPPEKPEEPSKEGLPFLLHASIEHAFFELGTLGVRPWPVEEIHRWILAWVRVSTPAEPDLPLLHRCLLNGDPMAEDLALMSLGPLGNRETRELLGSFLERSRKERRGDAVLKALAALARLGDRKALAELALSAEEEPLALALLISAHPRLGFGVFEKSSNSGEEIEFEAALGIFEDGGLALQVRGIRWDPWVLAEEKPKIKLGGIPGERLARIALSVPGFMTENLFRRAAGEKSFREDPPLPEEPWLTSFLAQLEVCSKEDLESLLRAWERSPSGKLRLLARANLKRLGNGVVERTLSSLFGEIPAKLRPRIEELGLGGKPLDALCFWLGEMSKPGGNPVFLPDLGLLKDARVRAYLEHIRNRRELGLYIWATGQLALQGDPEALKELFEGFEQNREIWIVEAGLLPKLPQRDLSRLPVWIRKLESNCCLSTTVREVFLHFFDMDLDVYRRVLPDSEQILALGESFREGFQWSRIAGAFVPVPGRARARAAWIRRKRR